MPTDVAHVAVSREVLDTWDTEARENAKEQAQSIRRDRDAQLMLEAHIVASSPQESDVQSFNSMRLYARVGRFYKFLSDADMRSMHYMRFYAYLREMNVMIEERNNAMKQGQNTNNNHVHGSLMVDNPEVAQLMLRKQFGGKPQEYRGETVQLLND